MKDGVVILDKPPGMTSSVAVELARKRLGTDRVGHGGTLDPMATGVLPLAVGSATKLASFLLGDDKTYVADAVLGVATDTLDRTGVVVDERAWQHVTREAVEAAMVARLGEHDQVPPMYSAIKVGGRRLHRMARAGEEIERAPRRVRIDRFELLAFEPPRLRLAIACGKGTYVRSLVADLASDLGTVAHLGELRRTRSGRFAIEDAVSIDALSVDTPMLPLVAISQLPEVVVPAELHRLVIGAVQLEVTRFAGVVPERGQLVSADGRLMAIVHVEAGKLFYDRVLPELFR